MMLPQCAKWIKVIAGEPIREGDRASISDVDGKAYLSRDGERGMLVLVTAYTGQPTFLCTVLEVERSK